MNAQRIGGLNEHNQPAELDFSQTTEPEKYVHSQS